MPTIGYPDTTPLYMFIRNGRASYRYVRASKVAKQSGKCVAHIASLIRSVAATALKLLLLLPIVCACRLCMCLPGFGRDILRISGHLLINLISGWKPHHSGCSSCWSENQFGSLIVMDLQITFLQMKAVNKIQWRVGVCFPAITKLLVVCTVSRS